MYFFPDLHHCHCNLSQHETLGTGHIQLIYRNRSIFLLYILQIQQFSIQLSIEFLALYQQECSSDLNLLPLCKFNTYTKYNVITKLETSLSPQKLAATLFSQNTWSFYLKGLVFYEILIAKVSPLSLRIHCYQQINQHLMNPLKVIEKIIKQQSL